MALQLKILNGILKITYVLLTLTFVLCKRQQFAEAVVDTIPKENAMEDDESSYLRPHIRLHSKPPKSVTIKESESVVLECEAGGTPLPNIHWLKDGVLVPQGDRDTVEQFQDDDVKKLSLGSTISRLYVDCACAEDAGEYSCVAQNLYRRTSSRTRLGFRVAASSTGSCRSNKKTGLCESTARPPRIFLRTKTMLEVMDHDVRILCRAEGRPRPAIRWLGSRGESLCTDNRKYQIESNGDLIIRDLTWADMGNYICIAENSHGSDSTESFLYPASPGKRSGNI